MKKGILLVAIIALFGITSSYGQTENKTVTIVKFSDYQCPACAYFFPIEKRLEEEFGERVEIISKHFPLNIHQYAALASRAAEAAKVQGKYEEMHSKIFAGQPVWSQGNAQSIFMGYAEDLNLDMDKFEEDLNSQEIQRIVMQGRREGVMKGVRSTPTFFINGDPVNPLPNNYAEFRQLVMKYMN
ncbi:DsbA family protein [Balneola sp. MJW-20]|uniref:DsbA family protein n=1 Tax=Gracilimonas aurantiaca TaxID=3234185 RepID=UPI003466FF65